MTSPGIQPNIESMMRTKAAKTRACYPRPLTTDSSGSFVYFTSSQLAHEEEADAQRCEIRKDDDEIEEAERKVCMHDTDF